MLPLLGSLCKMHLQAKDRVHLGLSDVQTLNASKEDLSFVKPGEKSPSDGFIVRSKACKPSVLASSAAQATCLMQTASPG